VKKFCRIKQGADDNMGYAHCMLNTEGYKYTLRMYNTYFSLHQFLQERAPMLRYTYVACLTACCIRLHYLNKDVLQEVRVKLWDPEVTSQARDVNKNGEEVNALAPEVTSR
jgi:hypothetical protein